MILCHFNTIHEQWKDGYHSTLAAEAIGPGGARPLFGPCGPPIGLARPLLAT